jgi:hypothetical protein
MNNDFWERTVSLQTVDLVDIYTIVGSDGTTFTVSFPAGTSQDRVYSTINAMAPEITVDNQP